MIIPVTYRASYGLKINREVVVCYLRGMIICRYKSWRILEIVRLAGTHFSGFSN